MMLVPTKLAPSSIHGIGLFAAQFIPKGTRVWEFTEGFDFTLGQQQIDSLSLPAREQFLHYAYLSKRTARYVLCSDDARFWNHKYLPNTRALPLPGDGDELAMLATRDIAEGEELTADYAEFDADPYDVCDTGKDGAAT